MKRKTLLGSCVMVASVSVAIYYALNRDGSLPANGVSSYDEISLPFTEPKVAAAQPVSQAEEEPIDWDSIFAEFDEAEQDVLPVESEELTPVEVASVAEKLKEKSRSENTVQTQNDWLRFIEYFGISSTWEEDEEDAVAVAYEEIVTAEAPKNPVTMVPIPAAAEEEAAETENENEEVVFIPESEVWQISARAAFPFGTARMIKLSVDLPSFAGQVAKVSVCTDFVESEYGYKIDYKSCPVRGNLVNGQFEQGLALMNQYDSAIGVIWFKNKWIEPVYQKFYTADLVEGSTNQGWNWN